METINPLNSVLVTCDAESEGALLEELQQGGLVATPGTWLDTGDSIQGSILLLETDQTFEQFSDSIQGIRSIFTRHLAPADYRLNLTGSEADLELFDGMIPILTLELDADQSFSVQSRILGEGKLPYRKVVLNERLSVALEAEVGCPMDCKSPQQVVSILCTADTAFIGVSATHKNRSAWPGGKHRFRKEDGQVSRAEFKLLEAISVFGLELPSRGTALDIGASPGGWTRMLVEQGLQVDAVDPGDLDPRLKGNPKITHFRKRIQEYRPGAKRFDLIVNDMKMDARASIEIMLQFASLLESDGVALMTLKMPRLGTSPAEARKALDMLRLDLDRLSTGYEVLGARQLYHNRSEVTVAMHSKGN